MSWGEKVETQACKFHFEKCYIERRPVSSLRQVSIRLRCLEQSGALETWGLVTLIRSLMEVCIGC